MIGRKKAAELHRQYGRFDYPIDTQDVATREGLTVITWPFLRPVEEVKRGQWIGIRAGLTSEWQRWNIAHALGHHLLHAGNQLWFQGCQQATRWKQEREAEEFAAHLLMPEQELKKLKDIESWELAEYFGVPEEKVRLRLVLSSVN